MSEKKRKIDLTIFAVIYFVLFTLSVAFNDQDRYLKFPKLDAFFAKTMLMDIVLACAISLAVILTTYLATNHITAMKELVKSFQKLLGPLTHTEIFFISFFSSLSEEFFFRGLIQGKLGLVPASIAFGVLHSGPGKKFLPWTIFALVMGFVLGGVYEWRENLILPVAIHFLVNYVNLILMQKKKFTHKPKTISQN